METIAHGDQGLQMATETLLLDAELADLSRRLQNPDALSRKLALLGYDTESYWPDVLKRRTQLLSQRRAQPVGRDAATAVTVARQSVVQSILDLLYPWQKLTVPFMEDGIYQGPGVTGTSGEIDTAFLDVGSAGFVGRAEDDGTQRPLDPKFWIRNWHCTIPFFPAPAEGWLSWRFGVSAETHIYDESLLSGSLMEFVTIGTTKDTYVPITNWGMAGGGWPINEALPSASLDFYGDAPVNGTLLLGQGDRPALGLIVGVIVSVASGLIEYFWGNLAVHLVEPPGTPATPSLYGLIEYRFVPRPVFEAAQSVVVASRS